MIEVETVLEEGARNHADDVGFSETEEKELVEVTVLRLHFFSSFSLAINHFARDNMLRNLARFLILHWSVYVNLAMVRRGCLNVL